MLFTLLIIAVCFVAFTNGANANFKGVASLYGSGTTSLRVALIWGTAMTFAGSATAPFVAKAIAKKFSGQDKGFVPEQLVKSESFVLAVAIGAACTSFLATRFGFPVSTTHALVGGLIGAGYAGAGSQVNLVPLGPTILLPLFISPAVAAILGAIVYVILRCSSHCETANSHTTAAASAQSPSTSAPATATSMSTWMSRTRRRSDASPFAVG